VFAVVALSTVALGFSDTSPIIAWSSTSSISLNALPSRLQDGVHSLAVVQKIVDAKETCSYDAVIIIEQPGLHASDLRSLSAQSDLLRRVTSSPSAREYPYVHAHPEFTALAVARMVSSNCQFPLSQVTLNHSVTPIEHSSKKHVFAILMPDLLESGRGRKIAMASHESRLSQELDVLGSKLTNHLVILVGSPLSASFEQFKRHAPIPSASNFTVTGYTNTSSPDRGFLSQYQLLTAELITSLLVFLFVILPIVYCGFKALASIQNTIGMDDTQSFTSLEKKNQ